MLPNSAPCGVRSALLLALVALTLASCGLPWGQSSARISALPDAKQVLRLTLDTANNTTGLALLDSRHSFGESSDQQALTLVYSGLMTYDASLSGQSPRWPITSPLALMACATHSTSGTARVSATARPSPPPTPPSPLRGLFSDINPAVAGSSVRSLDSRLPRAAGPPEARLRSTMTRSPASLEAVLARALLTPDPSTLIIQLAQPDGALLSKLAAPFSSVVERALALRYGDAWPSHLADRDMQGASGMYAVTGWKPAAKTDDMTVTLKRSATYWGQKPRIRQITLSFAGYYPSVSYQNGQTDVVLDVSQRVDVGDLLRSAGLPHCAKPDSHRAAHQCPERAT